MEQFLFQLFGMGPGAVTPELDPLVNSLAGGQLPPGIAAQLQQNLDRQQAQLLEQFSKLGAGQSSSYAGVLGREQGRTINDAMAAAEDRALGANQLRSGVQGQGYDRWLGQGGGLFGSESARMNQGFQLLMQEFLRQQGVDPNLLALMQAGQLGPGVGFSQGPSQNTTGSAVAGGVSSMAQLLPLILAMGKGM
jgi:hypothetical protein